MTSLVKIPPMKKEEYDTLLANNHLSKIAFTKDNRTYIAPFLYAFDGKRLYFLPSRYGRKMDFFHANPHVSVEVDEVAPDMSSYRFVTLSGRLEEVTEKTAADRIKQMFSAMLQDGRLSKNALHALGINPAEDAAKIMDTDRLMVWELKNVTNIVALKDTV